MDTRRSFADNSVATLETVRLGGLDQWVLTRGRDVRSPIILYLHGGPGSSELPFVRAYLQSLEDSFVVVSWEQRGAGKTFRNRADPGSMNIQQFLSDLHELVERTLLRFGHERLFIVGHSWGSALGLLYAALHPSRCFAFAGTGQAVHLAESERLSYEFTVRRALEERHPRAQRELAQIGPPPYRGSTSKVVDQLMTQRKWLLEFGGTLFDKRAEKLIASIVLRTREYSWLDVLAYPRAVRFSMTTVGPEYLALNLFERVPKLEIPAFFLQGRHDFTTPSELVSRYVDALDAPVKELVWFDRSAHSPPFEEPAVFQAALVQRFLPLSPAPQR